MNLKRAISAVCAAAVLVSTSLSDLPAQLSGYSRAFAEQPEAEGSAKTTESAESAGLSVHSASEYYQHIETWEPIEMTVLESTNNSSGKDCSYDRRLDDMPGVTFGETTIGELKELYAGVKVSGYKYTGSTWDGMSESDTVTMIYVMSGDSWTWNAVYNKDTLSFSSDLSGVSDDDVVRAIGFSVAVEGDSYEKLGLEIGDTFTLNPAEGWVTKFSYDPKFGTLTFDPYTPENYTGAYHYEVYYNGISLDTVSTTVDCTVTPAVTLANAHLIGKADFSSDVLITVKAVSGEYSGEVIAEAKGSYIYEYDGCDVNSSLEAPTSGFVGTDGRIYWSMPKDVKELVLKATSDDGSFTYSGAYISAGLTCDWGTAANWMQHEGLSDCDILIYSVDLNGDISEPYTAAYSELREKGCGWKADFNYSENGLLTFNTLAYDPDYRMYDDGNVHDRNYTISVEDAFTISLDSFSSRQIAGYELLGAFTEKNLYKEGTVPAGTYPITVSATFGSGNSSAVIAKTADTLNFTYGGLSVSDSLAAPDGFKTNGTTVSWDAVDGAVGYVIKNTLQGYTIYTYVMQPNDNGIVYDMSAADGSEPVMSVCAVGKDGRISAFSNDYTASFVINSKVYFDESGTLCWNPVSGARSYEVKIGDRRIDLCASNSSTNFVTSMIQLGYKPGTYTLDVYAVLADETSIKLGSVEYEFAAGGDEIDGNTYCYEENSDGTIRIISGIVTTPRLEIPAEIDGKKVSAIGPRAFALQDAITDLVIPEGVKSLGWYSFNTCRNLETVTLPDSLEFIDGWAFEHCTSLKTINVPAGVSQINAGAFAQNSSLTSITCDLANRYYTSVGGVLFTKDMKELVAYPGGIQGGYTVPATVNHIGDAAFYGALGLDSVTILGNLDFIGFEAFAECSKLTDAAIRDGVNYVGYWAFRGCNGIKTLTVPQSVTNIGNQAFGFADYDDNKVSGFSLRGYKDSAAYFYAIRHDIPFICIGEASDDNKPFDKENSKEGQVETNPDTSEDEKITTIIATPAFNMKDKSEAGVGLDLSKVKVKAKEIYDEEGIKRAEAALGTEISGNKKYNLLDLAFYNGDKDYSNGYDGLVEVVIPIPKGHRGKTFYCYRLLDDGTKELIPGKQREDSYVVYLEHFSVYAFVADEEHTCVFGESWANDKSGHWHECACGKTTEAEPHTAGDWVTDIVPTATEDGHRYKSCTVCGYVMEEETIKAEAEKTAAPVISPNGGTFIGSQTVTITCATPDAVIYYTTDGTTPTADSTKYSGSFTLTVSAEVKAFAVSSDTTASDIVTAVFTKKSGTSGSSSSGSSGGSSRPSSAKTEETKPAFNGKETSWADIAGSIAKLAEGGAVTISLNGNYTVPAEVMKQIADKKIKATFVVDSVKSWVIDGAQIKNAASTDLTLIPTRKLKTGGLAGTEGVQFTVSGADIPAGIAVCFKADFAGRFANLYKSVDGKLVFRGCAKLDNTGKATVPGVDGKGDYAVMLSELSALPGDMNNDGILNALDASEILKYAVGISAGANLAAADINGDGTVNASDAAAVLRMAVG